MFSSPSGLARSAGSALAAGLGRADSGTLDTRQRIEAMGLGAEEHTVQTGDGYILTMYRILSSDGGPRPVVFLQHGFLCSSADWLVGPRSAALGFILADAGYDVWLGNFRGNTCSRRHITLDPELEEFWQFSFDEHGQQDLPAMLDHVLATTGRQRLAVLPGGSLLRDPGL
jgi:lysosomal acid lipase/cholesteryl ester hydrolase